MIEQNQNLPLAESALAYFRLMGVISFIVLTLILLATSVFLFVIQGVVFNWWYLTLILLGVICLGYFLVGFYPTRKYQRTRWRFDDKGLFIYQGIWWRKQYAVPRSRVQHIDVSQGPLQRKYAIAQLILHTAGTMNASVAVVGLSYDKAVEIRDELLVQEQDDAV